MPSTLSTARLIACTPVLIDGSGTGANRTLSIPAKLFVVVALRKAMFVVDPVAVTIEHVNVHKMRPWIYFIVFAQITAAPDDASAAADLAIDPDFVRIDRPLTERMA